MLKLNHNPQGRRGLRGATPQVMSTIKEAYFPILKVPVPKEVPASKLKHWIRSGAAPAALTLSRTFVMGARVDAAAMARIRTAVADGLGVAPASVEVVDAGAPTPGGTAGGGGGGSDTSGGAGGSGGGGGGAAAVVVRVHNVAGSADKVHEWLQKAAADKVAEAAAVRAVAAPSAPDEECDGDDDEDDVTATAGGAAGGDSDDEAAAPSAAAPGRAAPKTRISWRAASTCDTALYRQPHKMWTVRLTNVHGGDFVPGGGAPMSHDSLHALQNARLYVHVFESRAANKDGILKKFAQEVCVCVCVFLGHAQARAIDR